MRSLVLGTVVALTVALAACGSSKSTATNAAASTGTAPASGLKGSPIRIGLQIALTGVSSYDDKDSGGVVTAWVKYVNATGGIAGHPVQLFEKDTQSAPAASLTAAETLVQTDHVAVIISDDSTDESVIGPYTKRENVPVIGVGYSTTTWNALPNWYTTATSVPVLVTDELAAAEAVHATGFGVLTCIEDPSCAEVGPLYKQAAAAVHIPYAGLIGASSSAPNYTAQCLQFIQDKASFIQVNLTSAAGVKAGTNCRQQGYDGWFGVGAGSVVAANYDDPQLKLTGALSGFPWWSTAAPVAQFRDVMKQYGPGVDYRDDTSTAMWGALQLFKTALAGATGPVSASTVTAAYDEIKNVTLGGLLAQPITFTKGQPAPLVNCFWLYQLQNGVFTSAGNIGASGNGIATGDLRSSCLSPNI
jgi:branched-chain amino acid transport system substrate-binding protein